MSTDEISQTAGSAGDTKKYWAFISYSSKDRKWGQWLHRRLESYPIPAEFQGTELFDGAVLGKNLRPIFRDRDELSGSANLGPAIEKSLQQSRFLIVLCSRNSAKSKWVNKEIEDFKAFGGKERILALILDGEPNATSSREHDVALECFPPALRYPAEPLAGDLRKEGDGKERGFLKVLSGIAQLDFDTLYRRHERVQRKKRALLGTIASAIILSLAGLTLFAFQQKRNAVTAEKATLEEKKQQDVLLWQASRSSQIAAHRADNTGKHREALAQLQRALVYRPTNNRALQQSISSMFFADSSVSRELHQWRFGGPIWDVEISPDANLAAATSEDGSVRVFDTYSGQEIWSASFQQWVTQVEFSPDGRFVAASALDKSLVLFDSASGTEIWRISIGGFDVVENLNFSTDGSSLLISWGSNVQALDTATGNERWKEEFDGLVVTTVLSSDGRIVAAASFDKSVRYLNAVNGELLWRRDFDEPTPILSLSIDGSLLAATFGESIHILSAASGDTLPISEALGKVEKLGFFSIDGSAVIVEDNESNLRCFDSNTGEEKWRIPVADSAMSHALSDDGTLVALGLWNGQLMVLNTSSGEEVWGDRFGDSVQSLAFSAGGSRLIAGAEDHSVRLYRSHSGTDHWASYFKNNINDLSYSPDGEQIISASSDGSLRLLDASSGKSLWQASLDKSVTTADFSPDGNLLAVGSLDRALRVFDADSRSLRWRSDWEGTVSLTTFSPRGIHLASCAYDDSLRVFNPVTGEERWRTGFLDHATTLSFSPDESHLAVGGRDAHIRLFKSMTGEPVWAFEFEHFVECLDFSPNGRVIAAGSEDHSLHLFDASTGDSLWNYDFLETVYELSFSPDGSKLAVATASGSLYVFDVHSHELLWRYEFDFYPEYLSFSHEGSLLAAGSLERPLLIFDSQSSAVLWSTAAVKDSTVSAVAFSPDDSHLAAVSDDNRLRVFDISHLQKDFTGESDIVSNLLTRHAQYVYDSNGLKNLLPLQEHLDHAEQFRLHLESTDVSQVGRLLRRKYSDSGK